MSDICDNLVGGNFMLKTGDEYLKRAKCLIEDEQRKPNPDNALIGFLCESVRLWREMQGYQIGLRAGS